MTLNSDKDNKILRAEGRPDEFPMRINRFLAISGIASRREADVLIEKEKIMLNGRIAKLGDKVNLGDSIALHSIKSARPQKPTYIVYNKPEGIALDPTSKKGILPGLPSIQPKLIPTDLLEKDVEGLVLLTNDRRLVRLLDPTNGTEHEYFIKTQEHTTQSFLAKLVSGVQADGKIIKARRVSEEGGSSFNMAIAGTRKDIQKMCVALHHTITTFRRLRLGTVRLGKLKVGSWKKLSAKELDDLLYSLELDL
jgi:23S rRNA pseudouridine2604 synthase